MTPDRETDHIKPIELSPEDVAFLKIREYEIERIARIFRVHAELLKA